MTVIKKRGAAIGVGIVGLVLLSACEVNVELGDGEDGSGVAETTTFEFGDFDEIVISDQFEATITIADGAPEVVVTVDDNFVDDLDVDVNGGRLRIGFSAGSYDPEVTPTAEITVRSLERLDVNGASEATVDGLDASAFEVDASGASDVDVAGAVTSLLIDGSGASDIAITADVGDLVLDLSGASSVDLDRVDTATVDLSGASSADIGSVDRIDGEMSGASSLRVPSTTAVDVDTSGASSINRR